MWMNPSSQTPVGEEGMLFLHADTRSRPEGGCYGGKHGDYYVQDFTPDFFVVHGLLIDS